MNLRRRSLLFRDGFRYDIDRWLSLRSSSLDHFHPSHQVTVIFYLQGGIFIYKVSSLSTGCYLYLQGVFFIYRVLSLITKCYLYLLDVIFNYKVLSLSTGCYLYLQGVIFIYWMLSFSSGFYF